MTAGLDAVHLGHADVEHDRGVGVLADLGEGLAGAPGRVDVELRREGEGDGLARAVLVVDHQHEGFLVRLDLRGIYFSGHGDIPGPNRCARLGKTMAFACLQSAPRCVKKWGLTAILTNLLKNFFT